MSRGLRATARPGRTYLPAKRDAFSLLEVVAGLAVVSLILIPTMALMQDVVQGQSVQRHRGELIQLAQSKQNEFRHYARVRFRNMTDRGSFASEGQPSLRYEFYASQAAADGGIPNRLLAMRTLAWHDANSNRRLDPGETSVDLWTCVSKATP